VQAAPPSAPAAAEGGSAPAAPAARSSSVAPPHRSEGGGRLAVRADTRIPVRAAKAARAVDDVKAAPEVPGRPRRPAPRQAPVFSQKKVCSSVSRRWTSSTTSGGHSFAVRAGARQDSSAPHDGVCARHQRWLGVALKRARNIALMPFAERQRAFRRRAPSKPEGPGSIGFSLCGPRSKTL